MIRSMAAVIRSCIRVMCVDDHPIIRQGLSAVLASDPQLKLVAQVATAENAIDAFRRVQPDVTLMDLHLPCMTGVEAIIAIRREFPDALILVMATEVDDGQIQRALAAGARGYLHKGMPMVDLLAVIHDVVEESKDVERETNAHHEP
jgi:DNA-binding NarL/FixJ family response regulator